MKGKIVLRVLALSFLLTFTTIATDSTKPVMGYDPSWQYTKQITIAEESGTSLTDYQVLVTLDTATPISAGQMRNDGADIRFTDSDGITELDYWIEGGLNTASTKIWVKIPYIEASSSKTIYVHYGNPTADPASNIKTTFVIGDDFEDSSLDAAIWTWVRESPGNWDEGVTKPGWLMMKTLDGHIWWTGQDGTVLRSVVDLGDQDYEATVRVQAVLTHLLHQVNLVAYSNDTHNFRLCRVRQTTQRVEFCYFLEGVNASRPWINTAATDLLLKIRRIGQNYTGYFSIDEGVSWTRIYSYDNVALAHNYVSLISSKDHISGAPVINTFYDNVNVRKYVAPEPTVGVPLVEPTKPQNLTAEPRYAAVELTWDAPSDAGSSPILEYRIYRGTSSGSETFLDSVGMDTLTYLDFSVSTENLYYYYVTAVNTAGESLGSNEVKCSSRESVTGIETVVAFDEYNTRFRWPFSIQQNYWLKRDYQEYWCQNIIWVWPLSHKMAGVFEIYNETWPSVGARIVYWWMHYSSGWEKGTVTMRSIINGELLTMENDFSSLEWHMGASATGECYIETSFNYPEIVIVGPISVGPFIGHVDFEGGTSGKVDTYVKIGNSETWLQGTNTVIRPPDHASTEETSNGLQWESAGDFNYSVGFADQGLRFVPDYTEPIVSPPSVPPPVEPPTPITAITIYTHCPLNLSLFDSLGQHDGYSAMTGEIDLQIPETFYWFSEDGECLLLIGPLGTYQLSMIGTSQGSYTLQIDWLSKTGETSTIWSSNGNIVEGAIYDWEIEISDQVASTRPDPAAELENLKGFIDGLPDDVFDKPMLTSQRKNALFNKINEVILKVEGGNYTDAVNKLLHDIIAKMDGDSTPADWIVDPETQSSLCVIIDHIISSIETLQQE